MRDVIGQEVTEGDYVCHVKRNGSLIEYNKKKILEIGPDYLVVIGKCHRWKDSPDKVTEIRSHFIKIPRQSPVAAK